VPIFSWPVENSGWAVVLNRAGTDRRPVEERPSDSGTAPSNAFVS